jgi:hypothetical protein
LLEYCKENWDKWDEGIIDISFNEYMKRTCQHLYFEEIFSDFRNEYGNKLEKNNIEGVGEILSVN